MSTPNPLIPQGTFQAQAGKGASNVRIAVATIVAIHVVFFGGLLLQGCKRDTKTAANSAGENNSAATNSYTLPPVDSGSLFYTNATHLPPDGPTAAASNTQSMADALAPSVTNAARDMMRPTNLNTGLTPAPQEQTSGTGATKEYTVARGDRFASIAKANGTTVSALRKANPTVDPSKLKAGMKLQIPVGSSSTESVAAAANPGGSTTSTAQGSATGGESYTVKAGDNLTKIAKSHGVTVGQLRAANNLKTSSVHVGQKLKIPAASVGASTDAGGTKHTNSTARTRSSTNATHSAAH